MDRHTEGTETLSFIAAKICDHDRHMFTYTQHKYSPNIWCTPFYPLPMQTGYQIIISTLVRQSVHQFKGVTKVKQYPLAINSTLFQ